MDMPELEGPIVALEASASATPFVTTLDADISVSHTLTRMQITSDGQFGARVKNLRELAGLTQEELAKAAKINKETVYRIERGSDTRATTMRKLRTVLPELDRELQTAAAHQRGSM